MANQPTMSPDALTGPGRALQGLGRAISGLSGAFEAASEPTDDDRFAAQMAAVKAHNEANDYLAERKATYTDDMDLTQWQSDTMSGVDSIYGRHGSTVTHPKLQQGWALQTERFRGSANLDSSNFARGNQIRRNVESASIELGKMVGALDPNSPTFQAELNAIDQRIMTMPGASGQQREWVRKQVGDALAQKFLSGVMDEQGNVKPDAAGPAIEQINKLIEGWKQQQSEEPAAPQPGQSQQGQGVGPQSSAKPIMDDSQRAKLTGVDDRVVEKLGLLQGEMGRRFKINSGYRSKAHNQRVGGASKSQHIHGNAVDLDVSSLSNEERTAMIAKASALGFTGIGVYNNAIHLDIGGRRAWGADYTHKTVPSWARSAIETHMRGGFAGAQVAQSDTGSGVASDAPDYRGKRGPASIRFNNPGAMYPGPSSRKFGAVETKIIGGGHKIAVFPDAVSGAAAQFDLLSRNYTGKTLGSAIAKWSGGNSVGTYLKVIERETGITANTVLTKEMVADPRIAVPIAKAMAVQEAGREYPMSDAQWMQAHQMFSGGTQVASSAPNAAPAPGRPALVQVADASGRIGAPSGGQIAERVASRVDGDNRPTNTIPGQQTAQAGELSPQEWADQKRSRQELAPPGTLPSPNAAAGPVYRSRPSLLGDAVDSLSKALPKLIKANEKYQETLKAAIRVTNMIAGQEPFNPYSEDDRKLVNDVFTLGDLDNRMFAGDPDALAKGVEIAQRLNFAPKPLAEALLGMVKTTDPEQAQRRVAGYMAAASILARNPNAFAKAEGGKDLTRETEDYVALTRSGRTEQEALLRLDEMRSPDWQAKAKVRKEYADEAVKSITLSTVTDYFDQSMLPFTTPDAVEGDMMLDAFTEKFREHYVRIGDVESAKALAANDLKKTYGVSSEVGNGQVMAYPPETLYPQIGGSHKYLKRDLEQTVRGYINSTKAFTDQAGEEGSKIETGDIKLIVDNRTLQEARSGMPPSYGFQYKDENGVWHRAPFHVRWGLAASDLDSERGAWMRALQKKRDEALPRIQERDEFRKTLDENAPHLMLRKGAQGLIDFFKGNGELPQGDTGIAP